MTLKALALQLIRSGVTIPEDPVNRYLELVLLKRLLSTLEINCVIDVGANRGQFAQEVRQLGFSGLIVSFEPVPSEFSLLSKAFHNDPLWRGYQMALGSTNRLSEIKIPRLTVMSSLLTPLNPEPGSHTATVEVKRLDSLFSSIPDLPDQPRVFLKMDTQGFDLEVFKGATGCLQTILGLESEISVQPLYDGMPHYLESLAIYEAAGFELYNLAVVSRVSSGGLQELNCFMRRAHAQAGGRSYQSESTESHQRCFNEH